MPEIGRRIYYEKLTGNVIFDTKERQGDVIETTVEHDFQFYVLLAERVPDTVGMLQLAYGDFAQDFYECNGYRINPTTLAIEFSYPDPSIPDAPPVFRAPLSAEISELKSQNADIIFALVSNNLM